MRNGMRRVTQYSSSIFPALLLSIFFFGLNSSSAQNLGDLARQERARNNTPKSTRVFTNEDLARPKILAGVAQESFDGQSPIALTPAAPASAPDFASRPGEMESAVPVWPEGTPLGDVARYYRRLKELRSEPSENPVLAQDAPQGRMPDAASPSPRQQTSALSPIQPLQKPKQIGVVAPPAIRENLAAPRLVRVSPGDSLWKIASRHLGSGNQWIEIASANPEISDPNLIQVGQQIRLPDGAAGESSAVAAAPNQVRVQSGDSLWKLAKAQWGNGSAWSCIAESNPQIQDSSKIFPGQTLALPESCSLSL